MKHTCFKEWCIHVYVKKINKNGVHLGKNVPSMFHKHHSKVKINGMMHTCLMVYIRSIKRVVHICFEVDMKLISECAYVFDGWYKINWRVVHICFEVDMKLMNACAYLFFGSYKINWRGVHICFKFDMKLMNWVCICVFWLIKNQLKGCTCIYVLRLV